MQRIHEKTGGNKIPFVAGAHWPMFLFHAVYYELFLEWDLQCYPACENSSSETWYLPVSGSLQESDSYISTTLLK